ncbi:MAG: AzlD domain-containing protein [Anaerolineaceae bacterium]|nr:AzlD domain-containing protein [Anaerolineaceae bacterium]
MDPTTQFLTILGMSAVTAVPRVLPLVALSSVKLPDFLTRWLSYVPIAVLAAMLFPAILMPEGEFALNPQNEYLWVSLPCALLAWKTKNLYAPVLLGVVLIALLRLLGIF